MKQNGHCHVKKVGVLILTKFYYDIQQNIVTQIGKIGTQNMKPIGMTLTYVYM